jgi:hypothetical protein
MIVSIQFEKNPLLFKNPVSLIKTSNPSLLKTCFDEMEKALQDGFYLAGFLSYEAGYSFEERLWQDKEYDFPLVYMGVYDSPENYYLQSSSCAATLKISV